MNTDTITEAPSTTTSVELTLAQLRAIASLGVLCSKDDVTPVLLNVNLHVENGTTLIATATDRYVAGRMVIELNEPQPDADLMIPAKLLTKFVTATRTNKTGALPVRLSVDLENRIGSIDMIGQSMSDHLGYFQFNTFPPIDRLFPADDAEFGGTGDVILNVDFISRVAKIKLPFTNAKDPNTWEFKFQSDDGVSSSTGKPRKRPVLATYSQGVDRVDVLIQPALKGRGN